MRIACLFITRKGENTPELIEAWDDYSIEANPDGFREACAKALASIEGDLLAHRYATFFVADYRLRDLFEPGDLDVVPMSRTERRDLLPPDMP